VGKLVKGKEKKGKRVKDYRGKRRKEELLKANGTKIEKQQMGTIQRYAEGESRWL
jgi:hypothetical protein